MSQTQVLLKNVNGTDLTRMDIASTFWNHENQHRLGQGQQSLAFKFQEVSF